MILKLAIRNILFSKFYGSVNVKCGLATTNNGINKCQPNSIEKSDKNDTEKKDVTGSINPIKQVFIDKLHCSPQKANELYSKYEDQVKLLSLNQLSKQIQMLFDNGIDHKHLLEYPKVITMDPEEVRSKLAILKDMRPHDINDYLPFLALPLEELERIQKTNAVEARREGIGMGRVYYFSEKLSIDPYLAAATFADYPFLYSIPVSTLIKNLNTLVKYRVPTDRILRDPWCLLYSTKMIESRLSAAVPAKSENMMPWMVKCTEEILSKSIKLAADTKAVLGENTDLIDYMSQRLGFERAKVELAMKRYPAVLKIRPTKIKRNLDFLLDEAKYSPEQIAAVPRILAFATSTLRERHLELESFNYKPSTLMTICQTTKVYSAFIENIRRRKRFLKKIKHSLNVTKS